MNAVKKNTVVTVRYVIRDKPGGDILDESQEGFEYLHGGYDDIFPLVEEAFDGKCVGDKVEMLLEPDDAFGDQDEALVRIEPVENLGIEQVEVGMLLETDDPDEEGAVMLFRVIDIQDGRAVLDGNHPLAGSTIYFEGEITAIRLATDDEVQHGHVHDEPTLLH